MTKFITLFKPHRKKHEKGLDPALIKKGLGNRIAGRNIHHYPVADSTNTIAAGLAKKGAEEGTVVLADVQTAGRGRLGREWISASGKNLLFSIIFRPDIKQSELFSVTMIASIAIVKAIRKTLHLKAGIKWPNDIYINGKKAAGILTELELKGDLVDFVVVGIGLNVNFDTSIYPDISDTATSLLKEKGHEISRIILIKSILREVEKWYRALKKGKKEGIRKQWLKHSIVTDRKVKIISSGNEEEGIACSIDDDGALIIVDEKGNSKRILSGDVTLRFND